MKYFIQRMYTGQKIAFLCPTAEQWVSRPIFKFYIYYGYREVCGPFNCHYKANHVLHSLRLQISTYWLSPYAGFRYRPSIGLRTFRHYVRSAEDHIPDAGKIG